MSRVGLRQWAAVRRVRESRTSAEQKPASPLPRIRTIATRSANRPSGSAPTRARHGAPASRARRGSQGGQGRGADASRGFMRRNRGAFNRRTTTPSARAGGLPFTLRSAANANMLGAVRERGICRHGRARLRLPRRGLDPRDGVRGRARGRGGAARGRAQAGLPRRGGNPGRGQGAQTDRAVRRAQVRRPAAQGGGPVGQALPHRRRIHLRDHAPPPRRAAHPRRNGGGHRQADRPAAARAA